MTGGGAQAIPSQKLKLQYRRRAEGILDAALSSPPAPNLQCSRSQLYCAISYVCSTIVVQTSQLARPS